MPADSEASEPFFLYPMDLVSPISLTPGMRLTLQDLPALLDNRSSSPEPEDNLMGAPYDVEDNLEDPNAFNLDLDEPIDIEPPLAQMENLAQSQQFISLIANATFSEEQK